MELGTSFAAFLILALGGWVLFNFTAKVLAILLSRLTGNTVSFRIISPFRVKDVSVQFNKGPIASVTVGEIACSVRESLSPVFKRRGALKVYVGIHDVEVVLRPSVKSGKKKAKKRPKDGSKSRGQLSKIGGWWFLSRALGYLHVTVADVILTSTKIGNVSLHLNLLDLSLERVATGQLNLRLECLPLYLLICRTAKEQSAGLRSLLSLLSSPKEVEICVPLVTLQSIVIDVVVNLEKRHGICLTQAGITCGDLGVNLNEHLTWLQSDRSCSDIAPVRTSSIGSQQSTSEPPSQDTPASLNLLEEEIHRSAKFDWSSRDALNALTASTTDPSALGEEVTAPQSDGTFGEDHPGQSKRGFRLPDVLTFELPSVKVTWTHASLDHGLVSGFTGVQVSAKGVQADSQAGSPAMLDVQCQCGAFELLRGSDMTLVDVARTLVHASVQVPVSKGEPLRAAVDVKVGGASCCVSPNLDPWLTIGLEAAKGLQSRKKQRSAEPVDLEKAKTGGNEGFEETAPEPGVAVSAKGKKTEQSQLVWDIAFSAPEAVLVFYGPAGTEVMKVTSHSAHTWFAASGPTLLEANCEFGELLFHSAEPEAFGRSLKRMSSDPLSMGSRPETQFVKLLRLGHMAVQWGSQEVEAEERAPGSASESENVRAVQVEVAGGGLFLDMQQARALIKEGDALVAYAKGKLGKGGSRTSAAKKRTARRKKRPAVEQVRFSLEGFTLEFDKVMEFRVVTVEGNPKSDGRPDLAQIVPVHMEQLEAPSTAESFTEGGHFRRESAAQKGPPLPCSAVLSLGKVVVVSQSGVVKSKLERCHLDYREEGLPLETRTASRRTSGDPSPSGNHANPGGRRSSGAAQPARRVSGVQHLDPKSERTVTLCGVQTASVSYQKGVCGEKPPSVCVAACGVDAAWEADAHLFLVAVAQDVKQVLDRRKENLKRRRAASEQETRPGQANGVEPGEEAGSLESRHGETGDHARENADNRDAEANRKASHEAAGTSGRSRPLVVSLDLEMLNVGADIGLGWQAFVRAQSLFSEDATIGVLLENLEGGLNDAVVVSSKSLQVSRHPAPAVPAESGETDGTGVRTTEESVRAVWDVLVQGNGTRLTMPFRLALREAEDAGEDTARALKYVALALKEGHAWFEKVARAEPSAKKKKRTGVGAVRLELRDFRADIEDEPFQSWLDFHYRLMSKQVREAMVREKLLAEKVGEAAVKELQQEAKAFMSEPSQEAGGKEADGADLLNPALAREAWDRVMRQASRAYKEDCHWRLGLDGAQEKAPGPGGQRTVRVSKEREHLMAISCASLNVTITDIPGGTEGMTQRVREMDSVRPARGVPFSRFYGRHTVWEAAKLRLQLRDYSVPLLAAVSGTAEGDLIFAQQATVVPPLVWQELPVGRWQIVRMLRSASGCTPPLKLYTNLEVDLVAAEIGVGTGFEPSYADISHAITTAIKKAPGPGADVVVPSANSTPGQSAAGTPRASWTGSSTEVQPVRDLALSSVAFPQQDAAGGLGSIELLTGGSVPIVGLQGTSAIPKERGLPWWDLMRYYVHGQQRVVFHDLELALLATPDPYEAEQMLLLSAKSFEVTSSPGSVTVDAERVHVNLTSGGLDAVGGISDSAAQGETDPPGEALRATQLQSPVYWVGFTLSWDCPSGQPTMHYLQAMPWEGTIRQQLFDPFRSTSLRLGIDMKFREAPDVRGRSETSPETRPRRNTGDEPGRPPGSGPTWARVHPPSEGTLPQSRLARSQSLSPEHLTRQRSIASSAASEDFPTMPTLSLGAPDLLFVRKWWSLWYYPPMKLRSFARWKRFGVPRAKRSGNLSLDKVLVELMLKIDSTPCCMKHVSIGENDPAEGLTFQMQQLKYDCCWYRAPIDEQTASILGVDYRGSIPRGDLLVVYQGFDARTLRVFLDSDSKAQEDLESQSQRRFDKLRQLMDLPDSYRGEPSISEEPGSAGSSSSKYADDKGFLLSTDCFSLRKQSPKADNRRLATWRIGIGARAGMPGFSLSGLSAASDSDYGSGVSGSEEEEAALLADNCLRVALHGLKLLWTLPNRDAVWSWVHDMGRAFSSPKPSPSKQFAQRKKLEEHQRLLRWRQNVLEIPVSPTPMDPGLSSTVGSLAGSVPVGGGGWGLKPEENPMRPELQKEAATVMSAAEGAAQNTPVKGLPGRGTLPEEEDGELKFMINVTQPQFNLHSDNARGRFLLAAASGRVLARSFHEAVVIGLEALAGTAEMRGLPSAGGFPIITWRKRELSILLEHVQAHVAPTDVDLNAGIQWLPKVSRDGRAQASVKQPGSLLERVFTPCTMVFQYTRHRGGQGDGRGKDAKMKPLKHFHFTSPDISASMTSRQFSILMDVITSLLLARLPRARNPPLRWGPSAQDEDPEQEEEADEVVPEGIDEVELARVEIEALERECKALVQDLRHLRLQGSGDGQAAFNSGLKGVIDKDLKLWMVTAARYALIRRLELALVAKREAGSAARRSLRSILKAAAVKHQQALKHPSSALRISWIIDKGMWTLLANDQPFAEAEINNMILDLDRGFDDVGFASFTVKHLTIRNCIPHPKCKEILGAWNPPAGWGKACMLKVEAKQGPPEPNGTSPIHHFQVDIHPLRIYLTEDLYRMLFNYIFPKDEYHPLRRHEFQTAALPPTGNQNPSRRGRRATSVETPNPSLSRQNSGDSLKSPISPHKPSGFSASPGLTTGSWGGPNTANNSPVELDPELMAEVSRGVHTRQSSSGYSSGEHPAHRRTASAIEFGSTDSALLEAVVSQPASAGRGGSYSGPLALTAQTAMSLGQVGGLLQVQAAAILAATANEGSGSSETTPPGKKRRKPRVSKTGRASEEGEPKSKDLVIQLIRIAQVELVATYEGSPISFSEKRFLMDTFAREQFVGDWRRLFYKVKKHIIWGVLKSVAGVQGKKFRGQGQLGVRPERYNTESGSESSDQGTRPAGMSGGIPVGGGERRRFKHSQRSSEGFVSSVKGLFNAQRRKAKAIMRRSQRGSPSSLSTVDDDLPSDAGSDGSTQSPPPTLTPTGSRSFQKLLRSSSSMRRSITKKTSPLFSKSKRGSFTEDMSPTRMSSTNEPQSPSILESPSLDSSPSAISPGFVKNDER